MYWTIFCLPTNLFFLAGLLEIKKFRIRYVMKIFRGVFLFLILFIYLFFFWRPLDYSSHQWPISYIYSNYSVSCAYHPITPAEIPPYQTVLTIAGAGDSSEQTRALGNTSESYIGKVRFGFWQSSLSLIHSLLEICLIQYLVRILQIWLFRSFVIIILLLIITF